MSARRGCVYIDDSGEKMIVMRGTKTPQLLSQCGVPWDKRFTFYDQIHTTGMDIKQDLQACAAITIGKDMTLRDFAQGAWRMRGLGQVMQRHIHLVDLRPSGLKCALLSFMTVSIVLTCSCAQLFMFARGRHYTSFWLERWKSCCQKLLARAPRLRNLPLTSLRFL